MSNNMNYNTASILFRPICSKCKNIIYGKIDCINIKYDKCFVSDYYIVPEKCPHCNTPFENIEIPTKLPFNTNIMSE